MPNVVHALTRIDPGTAQSVEARNPGRVEREVREPAPSKEVLPFLRPVGGHIVRKLPPLTFQFLEHRDEFRMEELGLLPSAFYRKRDGAFGKVNGLESNARFADPADMANGNRPCNLHRFVVRKLSLLITKLFFNDGNLLLRNFRLYLARYPLNPKLKAGVGVSSLPQNGFPHNGREKHQLDPGGIVLGLPQAQARDVADPPGQVLHAMFSGQEAGRGNAFDSNIGAQSEPRWPRSNQGFVVRVVRSKKVRYPGPFVASPPDPRNRKFVSGSLGALLTRFTGVLRAISTELQRFVAWFARQRVSVTDPPIGTLLFGIDRGHGVESAETWLKWIKVACKPLKVIKRLCLPTECRRFDSAPSHTYENGSECRDGAGRAV